MTDNVATLPRKPDPTAAVRQRRRRQRLKAAAVTLPVTHPKQRPDGSIFRTVTLVAALGIAMVSVSFSIVGLTSVFTGAFWPIVGMGCALETGKLAGVAWLSRYRHAGAHGIAIVTLVGILMALNAIGAYGFLAAAHLGHVTADRAAIDVKAADIVARTKVQAAVLADLDKRIGQIDAGIDATIRRGRAAAAMVLTDQQRHNRSDLLIKRGQAARQGAALEIEAAGIDDDRARLAADDGPIVYLAQLFGVGAEAMTRWFILAVAIMLDPLGCVLLIAATRGTP